MVSPLPMKLAKDRVVKVSLIMLDNGCSVAVEARNHNGDLLHLFEDHSKEALDTLEALLQLVRKSER